MNRLLTHWRLSYQHPRMAQARLPAHAVACPDCGLKVDLPDMYQGESCACPRCGYALVRIEYNPYSGPISYALASLVLLWLSAWFMFMGANLGGSNVEINLLGIMKVLHQQDYGYLANATLVLIFLTPLVFSLLSIYVFGALRFCKPLPYMAQAIKIMMRLKPWIMVDVFIVSVLVASVKMQSLAILSFGPGFWLVAALSICLIRTSFFVRAHWAQAQVLMLQQRPLPNHHAGDISCTDCYFSSPAEHSHCQVCHSKLSHRKPQSLQKSSAFLIGAAILYLPANILPIMITKSVFFYQASNILDGVITLWHSGDQPIAIIIFVASILLPLTKMIGLMVLLLSAHFKPIASAKRLTTIYRLIELVGRWSMIDVFVIIILMALMQVPLATVLPGPAVVYFCAVVFLSMVAAMIFDIRLIWDKQAAQEPGTSL
ncbi:PqiA/YebS family transporter subunit [Neisseriaceae bacterium CLB008]|nr:paraquat-inducible protein A [Neisseriaceae bacterium]